MSNTRIKKGSDNILSDLVLPDAEMHFLKAPIVAEIYRLANERKLTQADAGKSWVSASRKCRACSKGISASIPSSDSSDS
jgi:hypothetical protein